jgi:transketolase
MPISAPQDRSAKGSALDKAGLKIMADALRVLSADAVEKAKSGHPGLPLGMADVASVLFRYFLKRCPERPEWPDRDRFVLSAGHGSMLLYGVLHLSGYDGMTLEDIKNFRQRRSPAAGHPEYGEAPGIETTTGPLGQGFANGVGMALAERLAGARFGADIVNHYTYVLAGDGCLMEGISQEALSLAGHLRLHKLIVLFDDNGITIDGKTSLSTSDDTRKRFEASGWNVLAADGHNVQQVYDAIALAQESDKPTLIACRTVIGYGTKKKAGTEKCHGSPLGAEEIASLRETLGYANPPFAIDKEVYRLWQEPNASAEAEYGAWKRRVDALPADRRELWRAFETGALPAACGEAFAALRHKIADEKPAMASRQASELVLQTVAPALPQLIGGSADLTSSNLTKTGAMRPVGPDDFGGSYIYYGVREHAMAAVMNGMSLHGGIIPYGGTFLVFTDYCRPAIRLSALMKRRVIYVMTHDSIGLGEDGPTHQPVEHLASLRAIPNLNVFRPADAMETAECWEIALYDAHSPSVLALSRQKLPALRAEGDCDNKSSLGAYAIRENSGKPRVVLLASGSEVSIAVQAYEALRERFDVRVVSVPCMELLDKQGQDYIDALVPEDALHAVVEAGVRQSWHKYVNKKALFFCVDTFGMSAPFEEIYAHFGITAENIRQTILNHIE